MNQVDFFSRDRSIEKETELIIDYFKLIEFGTIGQIPVVNSGFLKLYSDKLYEKVMKASNMGIINLSKTNLELIEKLYANLSVVFNNFSISPAYRETFCELDWLMETVSKVEADVKAINSINYPTDELRSDLFSKEPNREIDCITEKIVNLSKSKEKVLTKKKISG